MNPDEEPTALPLFPLPNVVHFPGTELKLHIFEPRYRRLISDLLEAEPDARRIGMVLIKPGNPGGERPEIFAEGTAGLLVDVDRLPDGRSNILLQGEYRFQVEEEILEAVTPYRQARVRPLAEPLLDESDPGIQAVRRSLLSLVENLADEIGGDFPLKPRDLKNPELTRGFEQLVNRIAADLDLPALSKISLLGDSLPERALHLLGILSSRRQVLDLLRPFRHLAATPDLN